MYKRSVKLYVEDIQQAIKKIKKYTNNFSYEKFLADDKTIDAVIRNLTVIGEAIGNIPKELRKKYSAVPWKEIIGMRNKLIHEYFGANLKIVWKTAREDILELDKIIRKYFK